MTVAVIGAGAMGAPMARRLRDVGFELTVCDANPQALGAFQAAARTTTVPAECGSAEVILLLVATPDQARDALFGELGVVHGIPVDSRPVLAVMSTVSREVVRELAGSAAQWGLRVIDAPVSGGPPRATDGTLSVLVGGAADDVDKARPVLTALGTVFECGAVGNAQALKLINNVICAANFVITGEAYRLALECGLDLDDVTDVLDVSTGRNFLSEGRGTAVTYLRGWTQSRETYDATLAIVRKDVGLAVELAAGAPGAYVGLAGIAEIMATLGDATFDDWVVAARGDPPGGGAPEGSA